MSYDDAQHLAKAAHGTREVVRLYEWTTYRDEAALDAITVSIGSDAALLEAIGFEPEDAAASLCWANWIVQGDMVKSGGEGPYSVPDALERAEHLRARWCFKRVVISIQDRSLWKEDWGILAEQEGVN